MAGTILPILPRTRPILLVAVLFLALGLRFYHLDATSLWNDEGTSVAVAQRDLTTIARDAANDIHPPLYYWLLHGWIEVAGTGEAGVRSLSALLGVVLVALVYALGRLLDGRWVGLAAVFLAAISPFQVYYAQEARMYMLAAVLGALAFYAALRWAGATAEKDRRNRLVWAGLYVLSAAAGLYTHYAFAMILAAANLAILLDIALRWRAAAGAGRLAQWIALQLAVLLLFSPWLPTAARQLGAWPRVAGPFDARAALAETWHVLVSGPVAGPADGRAWPWLVLLILFLLIPRPRHREAAPGASLPNTVANLATLPWLALPVAAMLALNLFKEAYLKFLLAASPAFFLAICQLAGHPLRAVPTTRRQRLAGGAITALVVGAFAFASITALAGYYRHPAGARDDYRGLAAYIAAVQRAGDAVVLNAPGQQEVFGYYYHGGLPVYPLPASRPPDPAATEAALAGLARPGARLFAVLWATGESDPQRVVEGWLERNTYKAIDAWYGNVRLAVYSIPRQLPPTPDQSVRTLLTGAAGGDEIELLGYSVWPSELAAGDIAQITLFWTAPRTPQRRYKVFCHVLDEANNIAGQTDTEPGGGARPTTLWAPGEVIADNYGLLVRPGTPPGEYRVEVGLYDVDTGERLMAPDGAGQLWLSPLAVERPAAPPGEAALSMDHAVHAELGDLQLLGYDYYRLGYEDQPEVALRPGDVLHLSLYWRAMRKPAGDWRLAVDLVGPDKREVLGINAEPVPGYATGQWQAGDVWRGQLNLALPGADRLPPGKYRLRIQLGAPSGPSPEPVVSGPITIER